MKSLILWPAILCLVFLPLGHLANAAVIFSFAGEPGGNFSGFNDGGLYTVATSAAGLEISKPADNGSFNSNGFIEAGLASNFTFSGDFTVMVNFTLPSLPFPSGQEQLNESLLAVTGNNGDLFEVLRFTLGGGRNLVEAFTNPFVDLPAMNSSLTSGTYEITRVGSTITGAIAPTGSSTFTSLGSVSGFNDPVHVQLFAAQGENSGSRSTTALDIGFSGLTIKADQFQGVVPEPSTAALWGIGVVGLLAASRWRSRRLSAASFD